ncbi:peptide ABC transporter ATP-binding protein [Haloprofundus marisrubri]|uniref:Nickel import system ATP-binding protein NikD n=1 Tax=Haloprofundus marisrubri TaxID=1514971 RepID=A0A0W1R634_9EURY|nr:ABC transporter ATP-binding protein [Haloprofundus marisrubri]KTG08684.1 peptide ABC transporter ATP-binding protein [Haloprofundus marisrubri]
MSDDPLLSVSNLRTEFSTPDGPLVAVDDVSFEVGRGETVCLVGESGSGKTVTCESLTRLVPESGEIADGSVEFEGSDLTELSPSALRRIRGDRIAHVFQNPQNALDPVYSVGEQVAEAVQYHREISDEAARARARSLLDRVGIPNAAARLDDYPHEFSGGMRQRVVIAIALASDPDLLVADEPTTALDVTIETRILRLLAELQAERDMGLLFVTHDLGVVAEIADRVVVMYAGKVMERGPVENIFERPAHPYTQALLRCLPGRGGPLEPIGGSLPDLRDPPAGCRFHPRCPHARAECKSGEQPPLYDARGRTQSASCVFYDDDHDASVVRESARENGETSNGTKSVADGETSDEASDGRRERR